MGYRNKTYVCLGYDEDSKYYNLMKAWKENEKIDFDFYNAHEYNNIRQHSSEETIKTRLRERMANAKLLIVLIGEDTINRRKYVPYEIQLAIDANIPIIGVNLNGSRQKDIKCPFKLRNELVVFCSFNQKMISHAINNRPSRHYNILREQGSRQEYYYSDEVYKNICGE